MNIMRLSVTGFLILILFILVSCSKSDSKIQEFNSDDELIVAIQKAGKQQIDIKELPAPSQTVINSEFEDDYVEIAKFAPKLGYEVNLMCEKGPFVGERSQAYFNLEGRRLQAKKDEMGDKRNKCFVFVLPVTFTMPDGSEITIAEKEDWGLIKSWYETHPDYNEKPTLQFPVDVIFKDGTVKTIDDQTEMHRLMKWCNDEPGDESKKCFSMIYPITFIYTDGSTMVIKDKEAHQRFRKWHAEHPDAEKPKLVFPVKIKFKDGNLKVINNQEEMKRAIKFCKDKTDGEKCFRLVFPVTYTMPDGSQLTIETKEDRSLIKNWYEAHPDVKERPTLVFPVDIAYFDSDEIVTINNREELKEARDNCD